MRLFSFWSPFNFLCRPTEAPPSRVVVKWLERLGLRWRAATMRGEVASCCLARMRSSNGPATVQQRETGRAPQTSWGGLGGQIRALVLVLALGRLKIEHGMARAPRKAGAARGGAGFLYGRGPRCIAPSNCGEVFSLAVGR